MPGTPLNTMKRVSITAPTATKKIAAVDSRDSMMLLRRTPQDICPRVMAMTVAMMTPRAAASVGVATPP